MMFLTVVNTTISFYLGCQQFVRVRNTWNTRTNTQLELHAIASVLNVM